MEGANFTEPQKETSFHFQLPLPPKSFSLTSTAHSCMESSADSTWGKKLNLGGGFQLYADGTASQLLFPHLVYAQFRTLHESNNGETISVSLI